MFEKLRRVLESDARVAYALVFGSTARAEAHTASDLDVAVGFRGGARVGVRELGRLASELEAAGGRPVDLVVLDEAPPGLAYRVCREGVVLLARDPAALAAARARAILEYLDFRPVEELCARGVLAAARGR